MLPYDMPKQRFCQNLKHMELIVAEKSLTICPIGTKMNLI